jgi:hypothetical protein
MARQIIGPTRIAQRTAASKMNANFAEVYDNASAPVVITAAVAAGNFVVPAGYVIEHMYLSNTAGTAVTGGLKFGTTAGAADVIAAEAVGANALIVVPTTDLLKRIFSRTVPQTIYFDAVTAWNSASVDMKIFLKKAF